MMNSAHLSRIDLNLLVVFAAVLEDRHVGRAAARLNLTPSAVSHALGRLRHMLSDPLFLRTPKGVVPTARALELDKPVAEILTRIGMVIASAVPFDPAKSRRRFTIGGPDAVVASVMGPLLKRLAGKAPGINVGLVHLMPGNRGGAGKQPWQACLEKLERREIDLAMLPLSRVPPSFAAHPLYEEDFVVAMRKGHPFARAPTQAAYCRAPHLLVSLSGDPHGFIDELLEKRGLKRRIAVTVPTFMMALAHLSSSDLLAALPRRLVAGEAPRFRLAYADLPFKRKPDSIQAVTTKAAMRDDGIVWLVELLVDVITPHRGA